jgi:predicted glutamine amidotransferase
MCRLFGLHAGEKPVAATFWLLDAPDSLAEQSHRNPDGAGIGVFNPPDGPRVDKQPLAAWQDPEFARAARTLEGTTFVAHVRYASTGARTVANTHPFTQDGRLFAHNGVVEGLAELEQRLRELGARDLVVGDTDSERVFALITAEIRRGGADVQQGIISALAWIADRLPVFSLNFLLATGTDLYALRYPATNELYVLAREPDGERLDARSTRISAHSSDLADTASVLIASEPMDADPAWRLLASGELVHVDANLAITSSHPFPADPRHQMTLDDLDPVAAGSQHPQLPNAG